VSDIDWKNACMSISGGSVVRNRTRVFPGLLITLIVLWPILSSHAAEQVVGRQFYTAVNIWYEKGPIESTNYHRGTIIPLGAKVKITGIDDGTPPNGNPLQPQLVPEPFIQFNTEEGQSYKIVFKRSHAKSGTTIWDIFRQYFSETDPKGEGGAFRSLTPEEQKNVLDGKIGIGMSRAAVLMAYGYPPASRKTPSLESDTWVYREARRTRTVEFTDGRVTDDSGPAEIGKDRKKAKQARKEKKSSSISECIEACKENTSRTPEQCFDACNR
jgi:hypothetical protein